MLQFDSPASYGPLPGAAALDKVGSVGAGLRSLRESAVKERKNSVKSVASSNEAN